MFNFDSVELSQDRRKLKILDQTLLPWQESFVYLSDIDDIIDAIVRLKVRGAPAIGVAAAYGICVSILERYPIGKKELSIVFEDYYKRLLESRPTAVNLKTALDRIRDTFSLSINFRSSTEEIVDDMLEVADSIKEEDIKMCLAIAEYGLSLLKPGMSILTHCNAGHLAVSRYGTALGPIYLGQERGYSFKVYADETRPLLQGARLTAYELSCFGVDTTLQCDNMAASLMSSGKIDAVLVGCDRIAANGDVANKIGTLGVAIIAKHYGIPVYVLGPSTTYDPLTASGKDIKIEQREADEVTHMWYEKPMKYKGEVKIYNPAFDVTPSALITAIITEKGINKLK